MSSKYAQIFTGLVTATLIYILFPIFPGGNTLITLDANNFSFNVPAQTRNLKLYFQTPILKGQYEINALISGKRLSQHSALIDFSFDGADTSQTDVLTIPFKDAYKNNPQINQFQIEFIFRNQTAKPNISKVILDGKVIDNIVFYNEYITTRTTSYIDRNYIRLDLSRVLYKYNDPVSNYALTFLTTMLVPMFYYLLKMILRKHIWAKNRFDKYILLGKVADEITDLDELIKLGHDFGIKYINRASNLRFLQLFGPAIGFTLTVSSLISALNPSVMGGSDLTSFFHAIEIAMVSTFIGLLIRLLALTMQKYNAAIFNRADLRFDELQSVIH